jgi:uncharacterized membrane-anchored protein YhcB (DUF1043 family)
MIPKIKIWFSKLSTFVKVVTAIIGIAVSVYGGIAGYNKWLINRHDKKAAEIQLEKRRDKEFKDLKATFTNFNKTMVDSFAKLSAMVRSMNDAVKLNTKATNAVSTSYGEHLRIDKRVDEMYRFYQLQKDEKEKSDEKIIQQLKPTFKYQLIDKTETHD